MEPEEDDDIPFQPRMKLIAISHHGGSISHNFLFANKEGIKIGAGTNNHDYSHESRCSVTGKFLLDGRELPLSCDAYTDVHLASKSWAIRTWVAEVFED